MAQAYHRNEKPNKYPPVDVTNDKLMVEESLRPAPLQVAIIEHTEADKAALLTAKVAYRKALRKAPNLLKLSSEDFISQIANSRTPRWGGLSLIPVKFK